VQIATREGPLEWFGSPLVASLEGHQLPLQVGQVLEVARREQLALNDREVDLDLIEPTGMNRRVNQNDVRPSGAEAPSGAPTTVAGAVIHDEEHAARRPVGFLTQDLANKAVECRDAVLALAATEQLGSMHVPGGEIGKRASARIFVLNVDRAPRCRG
jgi:hypothetical protein